MEKKITFRIENIEKMQLQIEAYKRQISLSELLRKKLKSKYYIIMKNPIKIDFDKSGYQNEINRLYEFGKTLTNVQSIIQELTKNNISDFDLESINQWAKEHYNFINVKAIYQLNNLDVKYNYVKDFLLNNSTEKLKLFNINSKEYTNL